MVGIRTTKVEAELGLGKATDLQKWCFTPSSAVFFAAKKHVKLTWMGRADNANTHRSDCPKMVNWKVRKKRYKQTNTHIYYVWQTLHHNTPSSSSPSLRPPAMPRASRQASDVYKRRGIPDRTVDKASPGDIIYLKILYYHQLPMTCIMYDVVTWLVLRNKWTS